MKDLEKASDFIAALAASHGDISRLETGEFSAETKEMFLREYSRIQKKESKLSADGRRRIIEIVEGRVGDGKSDLQVQDRSVLGATPSPEAERGGIHENPIGFSKKYSLIYRRPVGIAPRLPVPRYNPTKG